MHELHARGNAHSVLRTTGALDATAARALGRALLRSGALRRAVAALCDALRAAPSSAAAEPLALAAAANLALGALRLARWIGVCSDAARAADSGILPTLESLRPVLAADLVRFVVSRPSAGADSAAGVLGGAGVLPRRVTGRLLSYVQCEALALFNALARRRDAGGSAAERDAAAATAPLLSLADISAPLFAAGEEADAREWLSSALTVSRVARLAALSAAPSEGASAGADAAAQPKPIAVRRILVDFYADGILACTSEHLARASSTKLQRGAAAACPNSLHVILNETGWLARSERAAAGSAAAAAKAAAKGVAPRPAAVAFESGEMGPLLPRGWLLLPLRAKVDDVDGDDGADAEMVVGPDGNPMRAPKKSDVEGARRAAAARVAALRLLHGAERERCARLDAVEGGRSQLTQSTTHAGHPGETALSLLYLAMCPSRVLFAPPILAHFEPLANLLAQRVPDAIVRGAARIGCVPPPLPPLPLALALSLARSLSRSLALVLTAPLLALPPDARKPTILPTCIAWTISTASRRVFATPLWSSHTDTPRARAAF